MGPESLRAQTESITHDEFRTFWPLRTRGETRGCPNTFRGSRTMMNGDFFEILKGKSTGAPHFTSRAMTGKKQDSRGNPQLRDLRFSGPLSDQGAGGGARARNRRVPADLRADTLITVPPQTPPFEIGHFGNLVKRIKDCC
ncbi:hypothetical protein PoB_003169200, partial [Plakobranchus ocellatus]